MKQTALPSSNYTMIPNVLFDELIPLMGNAEMRVVLAMCRKIFGYQKTAPEAISVTQLQRLTGLSRQGVMNGLGAAVERGVVVIAERGARSSHLYTLNVVDPDGLVNEVDQSTKLTSSGQRSRPDLVYEVDPQKKEKETPKEQEPSALIAPPADGGSEIPNAVAPAAQVVSDPETEKEPSESPTPTDTRAARKAERDAMYDALAEHLLRITPRTPEANGMNWLLGPMSSWCLGSTVKVRANGVVTETPGCARAVTAADILRFVRDYRREHPDTDLPTTLPGFIKYFSIWLDKQSAKQNEPPEPMFTPEQIATAREQQFTLSDAAKAAFARKAAGHGS